MSRLPCGSLSDRDDARVNPSAEKPPSTGLLAKAISNKSPADIGFQLPFSSAFVPNDEKEQDRLDLTHHIHRLLLDGELHLAPIKNPRRVLDIGTGTGIWAIDFADEHPESEAPPNCRFEIDDYEQDWHYSLPFDYIHARDLDGSVKDYDRLFSQAYRNLAPGGYFEIVSIHLITTSDDGTHLNAKNFVENHELIYEASRKFGKVLKTGPEWKDKLIKAGFVDVHEKISKVPQSPWPKDPKLKEIGRYHQVNVLEGVAPYTYALFTRVLGWERAEIEVFLANVRKEVKDLSNHIYTKQRIVYGRKPEEK
ncbi:hypothetical protein MPDQ_004561 [Monascus purpureus]|uniref:Methyltransferase domain-containing protein n=1 Tax=Monascus purpureus TaxID=5098 RepID=A0A507R7I6_MONPU|nr:hypothetical protein MPDQ_004561 [Monascus purpureus]